MTIVMTFPPDTEDKLKAKAERYGLTVEKYVKELVRQDGYSEFSFENKPLPTPDERSKAWLAWCASHHPISHVVDITRESIYEGRGE